jgi:hypothetical protein
MWFYQLHLGAFRPPESLLEGSDFLVSKLVLRPVPLPDQLIHGETIE